MASRMGTKRPRIYLLRYLLDGLAYTRRGRRRLGWLGITDTLGNPWFWCQTLHQGFKKDKATGVIAWMADDLEEYWAEIRPKVVEIKPLTFAQDLQKEVARRHHLIEEMTGVPPRSDAVDSLRYAIGIPNDAVMRDYVDRDPSQLVAPIQFGVGITGGGDLSNISVSSGNSSYQIDDTISVLQREVQVLTENATRYGSTINTLISAVQSLQLRVQDLEVQVTGASTPPYFYLMSVP